MPKKYAVEKTFTFEGKRYHVRGDSEEDVIAKMALKKRDLEEGRVVISGSTLLKDWARKCIETYKTSQNENTRKKYLQRVEHTILSHIGNRKLSTIKPLDCQQVINLQEGNSPTQVNEVYQAMRFIFSKAKINNLIAVDPTEGLVKPKTAKRNSRRALTPDERDVVIKVGKTDRRYYLFLLMLYCGCRPAEAQLCKGSDLFVDSGIWWLHIRGTKNRFADRNVPVPAEFIDSIKDTPKDEYIACSSQRNPITTENRSRLWKSFTRQINITLGCEMYRNVLLKPYPFSEEVVPYCLRHEYCTELARRGVDIRIAQKLMGHSSIELTANIYTNFTEKDVFDGLDVAPYVTPLLETE